jgi:hypothetical protein
MPPLRRPPTRPPGRPMRCLLPSGKRASSPRWGSASEGVTAVLTCPPWRMRSSATAADVYPGVAQPDGLLVVTSRAGGDPREVEIRGGRTPVWTHRPAPVVGVMVSRDRTIDVHGTVPGVSDPPGLPEGWDPASDSLEILCEECSTATIPIRPPIQPRPPSRPRPMARTPLSAQGRPHRIRRHRRRRARQQPSRCHDGRRPDLLGPG